MNDKSVLVRGALFAPSVLDRIGRPWLAVLVRDALPDIQVSDLRSGFVANKTEASRGIFAAWETPARRLQPIIRHKGADDQAPYGSQNDLSLLRLSPADFPGVAGGFV